MPSWGNNDNAANTPLWATYTINQHANTTNQSNLFDNSTVDYWKSATAAILTTRLYNYVRHYHKEMSKDNIKQYLEILLHPSFSVDQKYLLVRNTVTVGNQFAAILGSDPRFLKYMLDK